MILVIVQRNLFLTGYCISYRMCSTIVFLKRVCSPEKYVLKLMNCGEMTLQRISGPEMYVIITKSLLYDF